MVSIVTPDTIFGQFWLRRFTRIAPLYWLVTAVAFFGGLLAPDWFFGAHDPWFAVRSALFLPLGENVDAVRPLLAPGWTLIFEFAFYSIIALCLAVRRPPFALASMTTGVLLVVSMVVWPFAHQLGYYAFKLVMLEFLFGIALGAVVHRIRLPAW